MSRKEKKYHYIYKTTNLKTGMFYVGMHSTDNLNDGYLGSGTRLRRSIRKNGFENFKIEILEFFPDRVTLKKREKELVNENLIKDTKCMNLQPGGGGGFVNDKHKKIFLECRDKFYKIGLNNGREKQKNLWVENGDWAKKRREQLIYAYNQSPNNLDWTGKKHLKETKDKIGLKNSINQKGVNNSQYGTIWITNGIDNKKIKKESIIPDGWYKGRK